MWRRGGVKGRVPVDIVRFVILAPELQLSEGRLLHAELVSQPYTSISIVLAPGSCGSPRRISGQARYPPSMHCCAVMGATPASAKCVAPTADTLSCSHGPRQYEITRRLVFTARCTLVQSAVLRSHVVCLSVRPSMCLSVTLVIVIT